MTLASRAAMPRLLVALGDEIQRALLRRRFTRLGCEVMEASDTAKAVALVAIIPFDLVLAEAATPGVDGLELLRRTGENRSAARLPVIVLTHDAAAAEALGAHDCLSRDADLALIQRRVEAQLRRRGGLGGEDLQAKLGKLTDAVRQLEAAGAEPADARLSGALQAAAVITRLCQGPELNSTTAAIDSAVGMLRAVARAAVLPPPAAGAVRVLCADHDAESRNRVRALLDAVEAPVELTEIGEGLQAAIAAETRPFDLILVNLAAPEAVAGVRAIRRNERQTGAPRVPVVVVAADARAASPGLDAGADLFVAPPLTAEALLAALAGGLRRHSKRLSPAA